MSVRTLVLAALAGLTLLTAQPGMARADWVPDRGWHHEEWRERARFEREARERAWREREWRVHEWREHHWREAYRGW